MNVGAQRTVTCEQTTSQRKAVFRWPSCGRDLHCQSVALAGRAGGRHCKLRGVLLGHTGVGVSPDRDAGRKSVPGRRGRPAWATSTLRSVGRNCVAGCLLRGGCVEVLRWSRPLASRAATGHILESIRWAEIRLIDGCAPAQSSRGRAGKRRLLSGGVWRRAS